MALTRITKGVIKPNQNYDTHDINSTGIITATGGNITGNLTVGGVLTYEDVTSIDSVGIITAQKDIHVGAGLSVVGVGTFGSLDISGDIDVDGHTNLDNVSVAGVVTATTFVGALTGTASGNPTLANGANNRIITATGANALTGESNLTWTGAYFETNGGSETWTMRARSGGPSSKIGFQNQYLANGYIVGCGAENKSFVVYTNGQNNGERLRIDQTGISTFYQNLFASKDFDVDGHTNLDNVSIAGVTTFAGNINVDGHIDIDDDGDKLRIGAGNDLQIYHSTFNYIESHNDSEIHINANTGGSVENMAKFKPNGAVELYWNNEKKLQTNYEGIQVYDSTSTQSMVKMNTSGGFAGALYGVGNSVISLLRANLQWGVKVNNTGATELYHTGNAKKLETTSTGILINQDLDVDGHTNLDNVSIAGVTTFTGRSDHSSSLQMLAGNNIVLLNDANSANCQIDCYGGAGFRLTSYNQTMFTCENGNSTKFYTNSGTSRLEITNGGDVLVNTGSLQIPDSLTHLGDTDTKIRFPSNDTISFETGGGERLSINSAGRSFFNGQIFQSNTSTTVFPTSFGAYAYTAYPHELIIDNNATGTQGSFAGIYFNAGADSDGSKVGTARISAVETGNYKADLVFSTRNTGFTEKLRINANGDIGINYSGTPNATLDIRTDRDPSNGVMCFLRNNTNDGNGALYGMDINGCGTWSMGMLDNSNNFSIVDGLGNSGTEYFRITSAGCVNIGGDYTQNDDRLSIRAGSGFEAIGIGGTNKGIRFGWDGDRTAYDDMRLYFVDYSNSGTYGIGGNSPCFVMEPTSAPGSGIVQQTVWLKSTGRGSGNSEMNLMVDGDVVIGGDGQVPGGSQSGYPDSLVGGLNYSKLTIQPDDRTNAFSASDGDTWHDVVIKQSGAATNNAVGIAFEVSANNYHKNAGTGICAVKNGVNSDYGCDLAFITRPQSAIAQERMRIRASGGLRVNNTNSNEVHAISNYDHGNHDYSHRNNRVLTSNGAGWDGNDSTDGADPILILSVADRGGNSDIGDAYGLCLHSDSQDDNDYGPLIGWSNRSNSGNYNTTYAAIVGQKTGQATDANWSSGALHFFTNKPGSGGYMTNVADLAINEDGKVTMPRQPAFRATESAHAQQGFITFDQVVTNIGGHYNGSNGRFTAPVAGTYFFTFYGMAASSSGNLRVEYYINGSVHSSGEHWGGVAYAHGGTYSHISCSTILTLAANDYVNLHWNTSYNSLHSYHNGFMGYLIG